MIRRCRTPLVVLTAVFGLAGWAKASGMATYQLINTSPTGTAPVSLVVATVLPAGSVPDGTNPDSTANPLSILPGSSGFSVDDLVNGLGSGTLADNSPIEVLKLSFDNLGKDTGQGLAPGGVLNFGLMLDPSYNGPPPTLMLAPGTTGLSLLPYTPPPANPPPTDNGGSSGSTGGGSAAPSTGSGSDGTTTQTPEPISLVLWSAASAFGLLRARAFRRSRSLEI